jgi:hypothetical protein
MIIVKSIPGEKIAVKYDNQKDPFFEVKVKDSISNIARFQVGKDLLQAIQNANPEYTGQPGVFPTGVNILIIPTDEKMTLYSPNFHKPTDTGVDGTDYSNGIFNDQKDQFFQIRPNATYYRTGAEIKHASKDTIAGGNGKGTVAVVYFSNARQRLSSGLANPAFIGLAHELIHALHSLNGEKKPTTEEEENRTVGLGKYAKEKFCENSFRKAARLSRRLHY